MQRRKFLATVGSIAAGSAAAIGTGAVGQQMSPRSVNVDVVHDVNGTLALIADEDDAGSLENAEYASYDGNGQLELRFDGTANAGNGLNPDSTYYFDNVFQVLNQSQDQLRLSFDKSELQHSDAITFYAHQTNGSLIGDRSSDYGGGISSGFGVNIGVKIETPDFTQDDWEMGKVTIIAQDTSDQNISV